MATTDQARNPGTSRPNRVSVPMNSKYFGLMRRREAWVPTWRAWLLVLALLCGGSAMGVLKIHDFLAVNAPTNSRVMVLEGWIPRYAATGYVTRVVGDYDKIYTTGGPTLADHKSRDDSDTYASVARSRLMRAGVPAEKVQYVPSWGVERDRTYAAAVALRKWCASNHVQLAAFNVITLGPHARRSRLLYEKAFGSGVKVGVIPLENQEYDPDRWWRYSEGVKETLAESAAYLYSRFLFSPD